MATPIPTGTPTAPYFSSRGKKIAIVVGLVIGGVIAYRLLKGVIKQKDNRDEVQEAYNELDKLNQSPATAQKISKLQAEQYANVIFTEPIYRCRDLVKSYLKSNEIIPIGRFGEWDYLWSDQSLLSGMNCFDHAE